MIFPWNILESFLAIFNTIFANAHASYLFGRESNTFEVNFLEVLSLGHQNAQILLHRFYMKLILCTYLPNLPFQELLNQRNLGKA